MCVFCHEALSSREDVEALACGHVFHASCLDKYMEATGRRKCPFKCGWEIPQVEVAEWAAEVDQEAATGPPTAAPADEAAVVDLAARADAFSEEAEASLA